MNSQARCFQSGMTLIEVLVSVLVMAIGLLGAAAIQLNALKYTDGSIMTSQASFIAYDMMDRIRANVDGNATANGSTDVLSTYRLSSLSAAPATVSSARDQDLVDFKDNITDFAKTSGANSKIEIGTNRVVTITVYWDESRAGSAGDVAAGNTPAATYPRSFVLRSQIGVTP